MRQKGTSVPNYRTVFSALPTGVKQPNATAVATIIDPVDGGRRKSSSSYMFCCEALLSAICTDLLAFCEGVNVFGGSCRGCLRSPHAVPFASLLSISRIIV